MAMVTMPQLGETVTEGTVGRWLKKQGDKVAKYEPLLEVETDKVASEIPSPFAGTLYKILVEEGTTVPVGAPVCEISESGAAASSTSAQTGGGAASAAPPTTSVGATDSAPANVPAVKGGSGTSGDGVRYSPAVRRLARQHGLDLRNMPGTGRGGRITARDVQSVVESGAGRVASVAQAKAATSAGAPAAQSVTAPPVQPH